MDCLGFWGNSQVTLSLYPTLFRWTLDTLSDTLNFALLYIPHCSDGPVARGFSIIPLLDFISHIVQMDPKILEILPEEFITLYPTLFRWTWG